MGRRAVSGWNTNANANVAVNVDVVAVGRAISDALHESANRRSSLNAALEAAFYGFGQRYNVMVCNLALEHQEDLPGAWFQSFKYGDLNFGVWVFRSGRFVRHGDGGYDNWQFKGRFIRYFEKSGRLEPHGDGNVVVFEPL